MTLKELVQKVNKFAEENPDLLDEYVATLKEEVVIGEYIEDEEASEDNDWSPAGHWKIGKTVCLLPEKVEGEWSTK
jgi:hypothetical protein